MADMRTEIAFHGLRLRFGSTKSYGELVAALLADIGDRPVPIDDIAVGSDSWDSYEREVRSHVGPSSSRLLSFSSPRRTTAGAQSPTWCPRR
jgi:hypothetical protein